MPETKGVALEEAGVNLGIELSEEDVSAGSLGPRGHPGQGETSLVSRWIAARHSEIAIFGPGDRSRRRIPLNGRHNRSR